MNQMKFEVEIEKLPQMFYNMRKLRNLTMHQVQEKTDLSFITVHNIEKRGMFPRLKTILELQKLYKFKITFLVSDNLQTELELQPENTMQTESVVEEMKEKAIQITNNNAAQ